MEETAANPELSHEIVNDVPVLMHLLGERMGVGRALDEIVERHGNRLGLSVGQVMTTWMAHILSECNHFMSHVQDWANGLPGTLSIVLGQEIRETDLGDERLSEVVRDLSDDEVWHKLEHKVSGNMIRAYNLKIDRVRLDATTASVYSNQEAGVLFQRGYSKDHRPDLRQLKVMVAALDPLGVVVGADVVAGNESDDGLYVPMIKRMQTSLVATGLLYVGDCKMGALSTRSYIQQSNNFYLMPLSNVGDVPDQLDKWVEDGLSGRAKLVTLTAGSDDNGSPSGAVIGQGYEITRRVHDDETGTSWNERVMIVRSDAFAEAARKGLTQRIKRASAALSALTPEPGRGKRKITDLAALEQAAGAVLKKHQVEGLLSWKITTIIETKSLRAYGDRPARIEQKQRLQIQVKQNTSAIQRVERHLGWRAYATNAPTRLLSLQEAVLSYHHEWLIERDFARLKGRSLSLSPLWLKREDHAIGMTRLLTLAVRLLALAEHEARLNLKQDNQSLAGLYPSRKNRVTHVPTTERLLHAFNRIVVTTIRIGNSVKLYLTPLSDLQRTILSLLGCPADLYQRLTTNLGFA
jgi:transposase